MGMGGPGLEEEHNGHFKYDANGNPIPYSYLSDKSVGQSMGGLQPFNYGMTQTGPYADAARATQDSNRDATNFQTWANRPNQANPFSNQGWTQGPDGQWTQQTGFNGQLGDASNNLMKQWLGNTSQPFDDGSAARDSAINAAYGQSVSRLNPQWAQQEEQTASGLANQGLDPNSQAYRNAMQAQSMAKNDAYGSAMNSAIGQGTAAQQATFNQNMQARNMPLQQLQGMQGLLGQQGFNAAGNYGGANYLGAYGQGQNYGLQSEANNNAMWGDIGKGAATLGAVAVGGLVGGGGGKKSSSPGDTTPDYGGGMDAPTPMDPGEGTNIGDYRAPTYGTYSSSLQAQPTGVKPFSFAPGQPTTTRNPFSPFSFR